jgi:thiamine transport system permease protein
MAERPVALNSVAGIALALLALATTAGLLPVMSLALPGGGFLIDPYLLRVLTFTLVQAGLSSVLSLALGLPLARALAQHRHFAGRALLVRLLNLPLALPAVVVVIGLVEVYGTNGWLGGLFSLYGLPGILLAHVFFNAPLAARLLLAEIERLPEERWKLGAALGFGAAERWRHVEWPALRASLPGLALLIFLLCAASFAVVVTLGGGPGATTLEVAIYQALRADFDPRRAAALALIQLVLCAGPALLAQRWGGLQSGWWTVSGAVRHHAQQGVLATTLDGALIAAAAFLLLPPLLALTASGLPNLSLSPTVLKAAATSLALGAASASLALLLAWPLAAAGARSTFWRRAAAPAVLVAWIVPPAVIATGWFIILAAGSGSIVLAAALVVTMNAMMALPFTHGALAPAVAQAAAHHDRLCQALDIAGWNRFWRIDLPALARPLALALTMALVLSLGDLTAIALFGTHDFLTLPALIYRQMGSYRFDEAIGTALLLGLMVLGLSQLVERWRPRA